MEFCTEISLKIFSLCLITLKRFIHLDIFVLFFQFVLDKNLLAPRGSLVFDNVYWSGHPYTVSPDKYEVMREFNNCLKEDPRVFQVNLFAKELLLVLILNNMYICYLIFISIL